MSQLSATDVAHLGHLARLGLTEPENARYASELSSVVAYVEQLSAVDTSAVGQLTGVTGLKNVLADDLPRKKDDQCTIDSASAVAAAPAQADGFFVVRAVLDEGM